MNCGEDCRCLTKKLELKEKIKIIEKYIQQLKNSEYGWKQTREIVVSALTGFMGKELKRKKIRKTEV